MKNRRGSDGIEALKRHCFRELRLSDRDVALLRLSVRRDASPADLFSFYQTVDFDALQGQQACALASLSRRMEDRGVPEELVPRVKGIFRYHSARNASQMKELYNFLQKANQAGADVMLLDGAAMKAYYLPQAVRYMGAFSLRIKEGQAGNAIRALKEAGDYAVSTGARHQLVFQSRQNPGIRFVCSPDRDSGADPGEDFRAEGAVETSFRGERVFIPSREALLFQILSGIFQAALSGDCFCSGRLQWALDSAFLSGEDGFRWEKLRELCRRQDRTTEMLTMLKILKDLFPALVPEEAFSHLSLSEAEKKRMPLFLRFIQVKEKHASLVQAGAGKRKSLRYDFCLLRLYWYRNRCLEKRSGLAADLFSFPSFLKSSLGAETWPELFRFILTGLRETI
ncbi:MAG: nucleotidyltransferase family protein [Clostridia bacterium]|nr:nucleotidyltransferase family protein [Clostridia bacterium]